ncbi:hypothetical protein RhiirA4_445082 [Rhizophagus irregularis]|uniref:Uncharacterized protein n=1 Tax=Rhizophagus irregularis TaxID=588596 RepID=A0A2I1GMQ2_9GLOM|nr:hypothetical protein RhiirA4_445082 [Rhizophagus irregularis]
MSSKEKKQKRKVAWSEEDEVLRQALIDNAEAYAKAQEKVLSIPGTSVIEDIQYAMSLLYEQYKAEEWPDMFKAKYDLSRAESPTKEALVAARFLEEHSNIAAVLYQQHNYDYDWILNESSRILSNAIGEEYDDDFMKGIKKNVEDEEIISNITNKRISIKDPLNTEGVLENVKENIYSSLIFYWDKPNDAGLIAFLLDSCYKELDFVELKDDKNRIIQKLHDEFSNNFPDKSPQVIEFPNDSITPTQDTKSSLRSHKEYHQRRQMKIKKVGRLNSGNNNSDEIDNYLNMPAAQLHLKKKIY